MEIEFEFDMVFFGIRLVYHMLFVPLGFTSNTLHDLLKVINL